jgi:predicted dehydrogenase
LGVQSPGNLEIAMRAGIVGLTEIAAARAGSVSPLYGVIQSSHASSYADYAEVEVVGVCDLNPELVTRFQEEWSDRWPRVRGGTNFRELLAGEPLDLLSVCTSDHVHADIVVEACRAGVRAIFCEKPLATSLRDADRMIAAAQDSGALLSIDHTRRWQPRYQHARECLKVGEIGEVRRVVGTLGGSRAMLFRNGTHLIDTILMLVESEPEWVFAELDPGYEDYGEYRGDGGRDPVSEPGVSGYVHFRNGVRAFVNASKGTVPGFSVDVYGTTGRLSVSDQETRIYRADGTQQAVQPPTPPLAGIAAGIDELMRHLSGEPVPLSSPPTSSREVLRIILGMLQSQVRGNVRVELSQLNA